MNQAIVLGPLALQVGVLVALAAIALGWFVAARAGRLRALDVDRPMWVVVGAAVLCGRVAYLVQHASAYAAAPLSMLDLRDGGWSPVAGFVAAAAAAALLARRRPATSKPLALGLGAAAVVWFIAHALSALVQAPAMPLAAMTLRTLDDRPVVLSDFKGKPVVLNLWATWCPPCIREMPVLQQAQQRRPDVHFVFVNQGEQAARVQGFLASRGLALDNVLLDGTGELARTLGQRALPTTLFFDAGGQLVDTRIGALSEGALAARLSVLASEGAP